MSTGSTIGSLGGAGLGFALGGPAGAALGGSLGASVGGLFDSKKNKKISPTDIANQQLEFRGALLPGLLQQQQQFAPQFANLDYSLTNQFAPQYAALQRNLLNQYNPTQASALSGLQDVLGAAPLTSVALDPAMQQALQQNIRASQAARGVVRSPISALTEALRTVELGAQERNRRQSLALALGSQLPVVQPQMFSNAQLVPDLTNIQSQANAAAFQRYNSELAQQGNQLNILGTSLGALGSFAGNGGFGSGGDFSGLLSLLGGGTKSPGQSVNLYPGAYSTGVVGPSSAGYSYLF